VKILLRCGFDGDIQWHIAGRHVKVLMC
jgi:hypothetical protein